MLKTHRHALHRIPELGWELPKTAEYIRKTLQELPCRVFSPVGTSVCAYFDFGKKDTVAFRSDMDALPISEETALAYASVHPGRMHACGHDGHMAILLGLAAYLAALREADHNVLLIFEPAEETVGGAKAICETGILEQYAVKRVYGLHLWPELPKHQVGSCAGAMMSRSCELTVRIRGSAAHLARWQEAKDALFAANRIITEFYALAEGKPCLLRFGKISSGCVRNAVSDRSELLGSLRAFDDSLYEDLRLQMDTIAAQIAAETGCQIELHCTAGYPPVYNDASLLKQARVRFPVRQVLPTYITEDFSEYQRRVPGVFFWLGTGGVGLHDPMFDFDESVLDTGLALFCSLL